ncbi:hypothetical protein D9M69_541310 [compost metagenome]
MGLLGRVAQHGVGGGVRLKLLALLDADRAQHVHHRQVALNDSLLVYHLRQRGVKAFIHPRDAVPLLARGIDIALLGRVAGLGQGIHAELFDESQRPVHVSLCGAFRNGAH